MKEQDARLESLNAWLRTQLPHCLALEAASGDASFRRYFRARCADGQSLVVMDAPPALEPLGPFLDINARLAAAGVHVPKVYAHDRALGFALLEDLGTDSYLTHLTTHTADALYQDAFRALVRIHTADSAGLPDYDRTLLLREMALFADWFLGRHLGLQLDAAQTRRLARVQEALVANALEQPVVFVHRDYHSRNLMLTRAHNPGVLDHQDAVRGPLTYDLVSLLRDAYIAWPPERVRRWALTFRDQAAAAGLVRAADDDTFLRWFDLMGVQRHLKVLGIFARLCHRDGKPGYLRDLPRVLRYVQEVAPRHAQTRPLAELIETLQIGRRLQARPASCAP